MSKLCSVLAFDPGGVTGWSAMTVHPSMLTNVDRDLHEHIHDPYPGTRQPIGWWWGQLDSYALGSTMAGVGANRGHDSLNFVGENLAVDEMMKLAVCDFPMAPVVLEKFVLDPKAGARAGGTFNLLAPVRIISAFSNALHSNAMDVVWREANSTDKAELRDPYSRFYLVNRGDPKRICTDTKLIRWGFRAVVSHANRHACDATRIAYHFLRDCRGNSVAAQEKRHFAWPHIFDDPQIRVKKVAGKKPRLLGERI